MKTREELIADIDSDLWRSGDIADLLIQLDALKTELAACREHLTEVMAIAPDHEKRSYHLVLVKGEWFVRSEVFEDPVIQAFFEQLVVKGLQKDAEL